MAGQAATLTMENPHSPVMLRRPTGVAAVHCPAQTMEPPAPEQLGVDRVTSILGRPVYGLLGVAVGRIVDVLVNETEAWRALRFRTPNGRVTVMLSAEGAGAAAESSPARPPR